MADLRLRTVTRRSGVNADLVDGVVAPSGVALDLVEVPVLIQGFRRMVRTLEFDVSEMALTTYLVARAHGVRFTALPVFLVRGFHHGAVRVRAADAGREPRALLEGARAGVNRGYTVTTGVWARGILAEEHGVDLDRVAWVLSGDEHVAAYPPPGNVVPAPDGGDLGRLLADGDLVAVVGGEAGDGTAPLIPDPGRAGMESLRRTGVFPINHLVVVRDDLLAEHPDLAADLFGAFAEAKDRYVQRLRAGSLSAPGADDRTYRAVLDQTGRDPLPYGIEPNRVTLEKLLDHAVAQHILAERPRLEDLFAPGTGTLTG